MKKADAGFVRVEITSETLTHVVINRIFFTNTRPEGRINGQPIVDAFGQRINGDWNQKRKTAYRIFKK